VVIVFIGFASFGLKPGAGWSRWGQTLDPLAA